MWLKILDPIVYKWNILLHETTNYPGTWWFESKIQSSYSVATWDHNIGKCTPKTWEISQ